MKPRKQRRTATISVRLPEDLKRRVVELAQKRGSDDADVVREALINFVSREEAVVA